MSVPGESRNSITVHKSTPAKANHHQQNSNKATWCNTKLFLESIKVLESDSNIQRSSHFKNSTGAGVSES